MATSDVFPLNPSYPIDDDPIDRKVRREMELGFYERSEGADIWRAELHGSCTGAELLNLKAFRELVAGNVFKLVDKSFPSVGDINRICMFMGPVRSRHYSHNAFEWWVKIAEVIAA